MVLRIPTSSRWHRQAVYRNNDWLLVILLRYALGCCFCSHLQAVPGWVEGEADFRDWLQRGGVRDTDVLDYAELTPHTD